MKKNIALGILLVAIGISVSCDSEEPQPVLDQIILWSSMKGDLVTNDPINEIYLCSGNFEEIEVITPTRRGGLYDFETSPTISRDGKKVAYLSWRNEKQEIFVQDLESGQEIQVLAPSFFKNPREMVWAVDNKTLMFIASSEIDLSHQVLAFNITSEETEILTDEYMKSTTVWNPESFSRIVPCGLNGDFLALGLLKVKISADGEVLDTLIQAHLDQIVFNRDFTVAVSQNKTANTIVNLSWPNLESTDLGLTGQNPVLSPDGKRVLYFEKTLDFYDLHVANANNGTEDFLFTESVSTDFKKAIPSISWAADNKSFLFAYGFIYHFTDREPASFKTYYELDAKSAIWVTE